MFRSIILKFSQRIHLADEKSWILKQRENQKRIFSLDFESESETGLAGKSLRLTALGRKEDLISDFSSFSVFEENTLSWTDWLFC